MREFIRQALANEPAMKQLIESADNGQAKGNE